RIKATGSGNLQDQQGQYEQVSYGPESCTQEMHDRHKSRYANSHEQNCQAGMDRIKAKPRVDDRIEDEGADNSQGGAGQPADDGDCRAPQPARADTGGNGPQKQVDR